MQQCSVTFAFQWMKVRLGIAVVSAIVAPLLTPVCKTQAQEPLEGGDSTYDFTSMTCLDSLQLRTGTWIRYYEDSLNAIHVYHPDGKEPEILFGISSPGPGRYRSFLMAEFKRSFVWAYRSGSNPPYIHIHKKSTGKMLDWGESPWHIDEDRGYMLYRDLMSDTVDRLALYVDADQSFEFFDLPPGDFAFGSNERQIVYLDEELIIVEYYNYLDQQITRDTLIRQQR